MRFLKVCGRMFKGSARRRASADAQSRRTEAMRRLRQAEARGDTRSIGRYRMELAAATHDELAEVVWR